jgi:chromosomal replication initiation ATPase DnaA
MNDGLPVALSDRLTTSAAAFYGVRKITKSQESEMIEARHAVWYVLKEHGWSRNRIARRFGYNSSTVFHALKAAPAKIETNKDFALAVQTLQRVAMQWREEMGR